MAHPQTTSYIPLKEAAQKYSISEKSLLEHVTSKTIASATLPDGELLVAEHDVDPRTKSKEQTIREDYGHLQGQTITITQAAKKYGEKYGLHRNTILEWVRRGYITVLKPGYRMQLDEADIAYCARIYYERKLRGTIAGVPLLNEDGTPYVLKYPDLAERKRLQRQRINKAS